MKISVWLLFCVQSGAPFRRNPWISWKNPQGRGKKWSYRVSDFVFCEHLGICYLITFSKLSSVKAINFLYWSYMTAPATKAKFLSWPKMFCEIVYAIVITFRNFKLQTKLSSVTCVSIGLCKYRECKWCYDVFRRLKYVLTSGVTADVMLLSALFSTLVSRASGLQFWQKLQWLKDVMPSSNGILMKMADASHG